MKRILLIFSIIFLLFTLGCTQISPIMNPGNLPVFNESPCNCTYDVQGNVFYNNLTLKVQVCNGTIWSDV